MKTLLLGLVGLTLLWPSRRAEACGSTYIGPVYIHSTHPDRPFEPFASGRLGVIREGYRPMYLAFAWRSMMGIPTTADEQRFLVETWARMQGDVPEGDTTRGEARWLAARKEAMPSFGERPATLHTGNGALVSFNRIQGDALERAAETAKALSVSWKNHPGLVSEWLTAQDAVFGGDCERLPALGEAPAQGLPASVKARRQAEREYQSAAAHFYCRRFDEALASFRHIAGRADSPYQARAEYLVARTQVRRALMEQPDGQEIGTSQDATLLARLREADATLTALLAKPKPREFHGPARRLRSLVRVRTQLAAWVCELPALVLQPGTGSALASELGDLDLFTRPENPCESSPASSRELLEWIRVTRSGVANVSEPDNLGDENRKAYDVAVARWKANHRQPWLVTALLKARVGYPDLELLLKAAAEVPVTAPAGLTLAYRAAHLLNEQQKHEAARAWLAKVKPELTRDLVSTDNLFDEERMVLAQDWEGALAHATWRLVGEDDMDTFSDGVMTPLAERPVTFSVRALTHLDPQLTARRMGALSRTSISPPVPRRQLRWTAFARAAVVGDDEALQAAAKELALHEPSAKEELLAIVARKTVEERLFDARLLLMGLPAVSATLVSGRDRIDSIDPKLNLISIRSRERNGWCAPSQPQGPPPPLPFTTEDERKAAAAEWKTLSDAGPSVVYFSNVALDWAKAHPEDPRSPIALYRAVRASQYSCQQDSPEARAAFRHLHKHYAKSPWARRAPYVY
ncbi:hypothetical protein MYSTI_05481 [Myxococcus stipitatus DSM 14675]|uniref:Uncharacterized protein n=1 Tax=Myxococcus stipitatus (strain DSM 14675 / JCM 12634 / Mx s8) TaxID=1278073 RepID=L7UJX8_MYXSD|nr:hypothetical protein [Myxococcus stipitatus]AGC46759.1 hypothetical protein MYSTI_05481 [Myxococcus stipitatus DSM 14675]